MYVMRYISTFQNIYLGLKLLLSIQNTHYYALAAAPHNAVIIIQMLLETQLLTAGT